MDFGGSFTHNRFGFWKKEILMFGKAYERYE